MIIVAALFYFCRGDNIYLQFLFYPQNNQTFKMKAIFSFLFLSFVITSAFASNVQTVAKADTDINIPAPDFSLKDLNGKTVSLADYKGKTLVIDFWATWCVPCRESFPAVKMVMDKY